MALQVSDIWEGLGRETGRGIEKGLGDVRTPQGDGQTRKHGKWHLKANGNWDGNRGQSGVPEGRKNMYDVHHRRGNESMACVCEWAIPFTQNKIIII